MGRDDAPLAFRWQRWDPALWAWGCAFWPIARLLAPVSIPIARSGVAVYSRTCLQRLRAETGIDYDQKTLGILHVYRDPQTFDHAVTAAEFMTQLGLPRQVRVPTRRSPSNLL